MITNFVELEKLNPMHLSIVPQTELSPVDVTADQSPALVYVASLSNGSHRAMLGSLNTIAGLLTSGVCDHRTLPWWLLHFGHTAAVRAWLSQNYAAATANKMLAAMKGALKTCWLMGKMSAEDYMRAIELKRIKGVKPVAAAGRALDSGEFVALLNVCREDRSAAGPRDAAMIGLGVLSGLRREEITDMLLEHYNMDTGVLWVHGKGNKTRTVPVASGLDTAIAEWLTHRGMAEGPLFYPVLISGRVRAINKPMRSGAFYVAVKKRCEQAGVKKLTPHDMRRTFAGNMLDAGVDIAIVQQLMGHANASTTAGYDRRGERAKHVAMGKMHMNWTERHTD